MKERIIQVTMEEIMQRGVKFSIRDIASHLGISTKTIYQYFESKEQIIGHIVDQSIKEMREAERKLIDDRSLTIQQKVMKALVVLPHGFVFHDIRTLHELKQRYPKQWREVDEYVNHGWENIRQLVKEGTTEGVFRPFDLELFIQVYIGALYHMMDYHVANRIELSLEKTLAQMVEFLMLGINKSEDGKKLEKPTGGGRG
ncbi:TetR/AcrR family transcriptional regulator [Paenibacillus wynnii]|uniref:TetR/AcrR family transcriptional regulator n=1 Tax=Paenibacillus wynnii TaxID=268407 RepID=UPI0027910BE7|nr:TetR/AcrR family transcriptional regulator [Paenibacillus wynnii]MDQ0194736.1 AcrR family transcriptional regulator [Paenibacillus wynnii]